MSTESVYASDSRHTQLPEPLRSAVLNHEDGKLDVAYPLYRKYVAANPQNPTGLQLFGLLLSQLGQYEPAITLMEESLKLFPDQPEVINNLGNALLRSGKLDEAIERFSEAVRIVPDYVDAQRNLGVCYMRTERFDDALECFQRCVDLRRDDARSWFARGNARRELDDIDGAIADFERALKLRPDHAQAHHNLGVCLRLRQHPEEALEHYEAAQKLGVDRAELYHNIGNALIDVQRADEAIDAYRAALERDPANIDTHRNLNSLLWQQDFKDDYLKSYRETLDKHPDAEPLRLAYAASLNQMDAHAEAMQVLEQGLRYAPDSGEIKSQLAYSLEGLGDWEEALRLHEQAVNLPDAVPNHLVSYGRALLACQRPDEALKQIRAAAALTPFNQRALAYLGLCWRLLGDERDAMLNDYENLVQIYELPVPEGFSSAAEFNERLAQVLEPLHIGKQHPAEQTLRGGSQTSGDIFDRREPEIQALARALRPCIEDYIGRFPRNDEHPLYMRRGERFDFSASWSVRLARCGYHKMHTHPLGWISSAYYVEVPTEVAESDEHGGGLKFGEPDIDIGEAGKARRQEQPAVGRLALFPSYMWHGTVPFESDEPRMTVAFDIVPR